MSSREWNPGDVALIRVGTGDWEYGLLREDGVWLCQHPRLDERRAWEGVQVHPLVAINYEDREQVEQLVDELANALNWADHRTQRLTYVPAMQAALREFANPKPRIEEPTGLGAVVEADLQWDDGKGWGPGKWASTEDGSWVCLTDGHVGVRAPWPALRNVTVLRKGVTP